MFKGEAGWQCKQVLVLLNFGQQGLIKAFLTWAAAKRSTLLHNVGFVRLRKKPVVKAYLTERLSLFLIRFNLAH